jgi:hypothetical protein
MAYEPVDIDYSVSHNVAIKGSYLTALAQISVSRNIVHTDVIGDFGDWHRTSSLGLIAAPSMKPGEE